MGHGTAPKASRSLLDVENTSRLADWGAVGLWRWLGQRPLTGRAVPNKGTFLGCGCRSRNCPLPQQPLQGVTCLGQIRVES
jgi:hypothetical protein